MCNFQFFVAVDYDTKDDRLWYEKYSIRKPMLPSFISMELGTKASIAMYIKIMKQVRVLIFYFPWIGCYSIVRFPPALNLPVSICTTGWREAL